MAVRRDAVGSLRVHGLVCLARSGLALALSIGLEALVRRDAVGAFQLHGAISVLGVREALRFGRALVSRFFVDAARALLLGRGVDAARVALAFCVDETL